MHAVMDGNNCVRIQDPKNEVERYITSSKDFVREVHDYVNRHGKIPEQTKAAPSMMFCDSGWKKYVPTLTRVELLSEP